MYAADMDWEREVRFAAFKYLADLERFNSVIPGRVLAEGFMWQGKRITLKGQTGIWTPSGFACPISITSRTKGPYNLDGIGKDGTIIYAYRGTDPNQRDNRHMRQAFETRTPLIFFKEVYTHHYQAIWPVLIIEDYPEQLYVRAVIEPAAYRGTYQNYSVDDFQLSSEDVRRYAMVETRHRLHQNAFRELVIHAYDERCALCNLHHRQLLDAAHIIPDANDEGVPTVTNGLSLCKIHHAAFDHNFIGIDSNYTVHVSEEILSESDGPMLQYGLKELHTKRIILPKKKSDWPEREYLDWKFQQFSG
jgi:putative restriction endonuclease